MTIAHEFSRRALFLRVFASVLCIALGVLCAPARAPATPAPAPVLPPDAAAALERIGMERGVCAVLGLPEDAGPGFVTALAEGSELTIYFQSEDATEVESVQGAADRAGLLGTRVFADRIEGGRIGLADNLAGALLATEDAARRAGEAEVLRVLHPGGRGFLGAKVVEKERPDGVDSWSHPFHGPDNNPQSRDQLARAPYLTQFLAEPLFCPMPEISVAAGGRVFRAFGHIAHKANQNAMLNTLIAVNAYNGVILWKRPLHEGFMIHRNTLVATAETLYLADDESLKRIDAATGEVKSELVVPEGIADGPVWKWLAIEDGTIYALVGAREVEIPTQKSQRRGLGHWPWGMWPGHDYADPRTNFGSGRTFVAFEDATGKVLWSHREEEYVDSRGVCMKNDRIYFFAPGKHLAGLDASKGELLWRSQDSDLLEAIGPNGRAQHYVTGYATTTYIKCSDGQIFFAGPQRERFVVADASNGKLLWQKEHGNLQIVLREDGIYAAGPQVTGKKLAYTSGDELADLQTRRACTRATGSIDSVFYRTTGGTVRLDVASGTAKHIAPMRPPCQDGVIISDGYLYWGPWMCGCQLSLYGHIALGPAGDHDFAAQADATRLETFRAGDDPAVVRLEVREGDWPTYRADNARTARTAASVPGSVEKEWTWTPPTARMPSAPIAVGGLVFVGDRAGAVRALDGKSGEERWSTLTGGAVYYPPAFARGRLFVGSADGRVHALDALSGERVWSFRLAPVERRIPVYGALISTWPVAGGVAVEDGFVYAAAGIAHYDGTHVAALEAKSGTPRWYNSSSGVLSEKVESGVSLQGELAIEGGELRFAGGGVYQTARFDLATGECLNAREVHEQPTSRFQTAFFPYYPDYAQYVSLRCELPEGKTLTYDASYEGSQHSTLQLLGARPAGADAAPERETDRVTDRPRDRRRAPAREALLQRDGFAYNAHIIAPEAIVVAGQSIAGDAAVSDGAIPGGQDPFLAALSVADGAELWRVALPEPAVRDGLAIDADGRIYVTLVDGRVLCFSRAD